MKVLLISSGYPGTSGGSAINMLVLLQVLHEMSCYVHFYKIDIKQVSSNSQTLPCKISKSLTNIMPGAIRHPFGKKDWFLTKKVYEIISHEDIDLVIVYGYEPLFLIDFKQFKEIKKFILLGDPYHLVVQERFKNVVKLFRSGFSLNLAYVSYQLLRIIKNYFHTRIQSAIWKRTAREIAIFDFGYATAAHHASYYRTINPNIIYQPSPVLGSNELNVLQMVGNKKNIESLTFLYIGHNLGGTSSLAGLMQCINLFQKISEDSSLNGRFKVFIAGETKTISQNIKDKIDGFKFVRILGHIDITEYVPQIFVLLNTITNTLGNRTRIASFFAFGIPAISHMSATFGMPLLKEHGGVLLYEDDESFLNCIKEIILDRDLYYQLSLDAYRAFVEFYSKDNLKRTLTKQFNRMTS